MPREQQTLYGSFSLDYGYRNDSISYFADSSSTRLGFLGKLKLIGMLFSKRAWKPKIRFSNGLEMDFSNHSIIMQEPLRIHSTRSLYFTTDEHLILNSGRRQVPDKPDGYTYGVWANTDLDQNGEPILEHLDTSILKQVNQGFRKIKISDAGSLTID